MADSLAIVLAEPAPELQSIVAATVARAFGAGLIFESREKDFAKRFTWIVENMKHYNVVCAVVVNNGQILCMQRPLRGSLSTAGKWEFPGGKIEEWRSADGMLVKESPESALLRELREEMDYEVKILCSIMTVDHQYPDFSISLQAFLCKAKTRNFNRKEHISHCWLLPEELEDLDWAKADEALISAVQTIIRSYSLC